MTGKPSRIVCGAKNRRGGVCTLSPVRGRTRCKWHGGATPQGIASPQFKHGKYSKAMPAQLAALYNEAGEDRELVGLREELKAVDARLLTLMATLGADAGSARWAAVGAAYDALQAVQPGDGKGFDAAMVQLGDAIAAQHTDDGTWREIYKAIELRRRLVDSEAKRLHRLHQMISVERVLNLVGGIMQSIKTHVSDPEKLRLVQADIGVMIERAANA